jgi:phospholipid transport system substrate-binding protein
MDEFVSMIRQPIGRRGALRMAIVAAGLSAAGWQANAQSANAAGPTAPIQQLNAALLSAMQAGQHSAFAQRYAELEPVIDRTFDLNAVLAASVGLRWPGLPDDQKTQLLAAFRRYTVSSYAANFDNYTGQRFDISPGVRNVGNGSVIVETQLVPAHGSATKLDYVMRNGASGWRAVDVLADGSISRVAVQRSDFRYLLMNGGVPALVAGLQTKVASLSGGMQA